MGDGAGFSENNFNSPLLPVCPMNVWKDFDSKCEVFSEQVTFGLLRPRYQTQILELREGRRIHAGGIKASKSAH